MNFGEYLQEDNSLQPILLPKFFQSININNISGNISINFSNKDKFKGIIENGRPKKGKYTWSNGQKYSGNFSNDFFNGRGCLIFPNNFTLYGIFSGDKNSFYIKDAIYTTNDKEYQGSFKNNLLHGDFVIKNIEGHPFYSFNGSYYDGKKHGKFVLEKEVNNERIEIIGEYKKGLKDGHFILKKFNSEGSIIYQNDFYFEEDYIINKYENNQKIEIKKRIYNHKEKEIHCMTIFKTNNRNFLLLGSELYLLIYNINRDGDDYSITYNRNMFMFNKGKINDIIQINNENKFLLCSNTNRFKLIKLIPNFAAQNGRVNIRIQLIQEFQGIYNGSSIYMLLELSNGLVISGDIHNIIIWEKNYIEDNNSEQNEVNRNETEMNMQTQNIFQRLFEEAKNCLERNFQNNLAPDIFNRNINQHIRVNNEENNVDDLNDNQNFNYELKFSINKDDEDFELSHIFCVLEIKRRNNIIVIAVAQSDSKRLYFFEIIDSNDSNEDNNYRQIQKIENINSIKNSKKIMYRADNDNILLVGCYNEVAIVNLNNYELIKFFNFDSITNFSDYINNSFICATMKKGEGLHNYRSFLTQAEFVKKEYGENVKIRIISQNLNYHQGNIIDTSIINANYNNRNSLIITIGADGKIIALL